MPPDTTANPFRLEGDVALVTGGGTGLGRAAARRLADAGAKVVITGRREDVLKTAAAELGVGYAVHDVTQLDAAGRLLEQVADRCGGPPTILVNNAGINLKKPAVETTEAEFERVMLTNVTGAFALSRAAAPAMIQRGGGSILFIASMASLFGIPGVVAYTASKTAVVGLVRSLAVDLSPSGVRVNAVAPGWIDSAMLRKSFDGDAQRRDKILARTPLGRVGEPDDVAQALVYLASPAAKFVTGVVLPVDGGVSIGF